jgi:transposase
MCHNVVVYERHNEREPSTMQITAIGLDLAKHWFQVHGVDADGRIVVRRRLWRSGVIAYFRSLGPCLVGMEACATAHHWARELMALGHTVKLMLAAYVKAYVKRNKNDAADAAAICEAILQTIVDQLNGTMARTREIEGRLARWHRQSRVSRLLATVPGVGIMGASAIAATVADPSLFRSGREFAAWLGMTPRQNSSGGKERPGRTSKRGDKYIRSPLTAGAVAVLRHARNRPTRDGEWVRALLARKPTKLAAVALANKTARIVWAVMMREEGYQATEVFGQPA